MEVQIQPAFLDNSINQQDVRSSWSKSQSSSSYSTKRSSFQTSDMSEPQVTEHSSSSSMRKSSNSFNNSNNMEDFGSENLNRLKFSSDFNGTNINSMRKAIQDSSSTTKTMSLMQSGMDREDNLTYDIVKRADGKNEVQIVVTARDFAPEELEVKLTDNTLTVTGKHEERSDSSYAAKSFYRMCTIPTGIRPGDLNCSLDSHGRLLITAVVPENSNGMSSKMITSTMSKQMQQQMNSANNMIRNEFENGMNGSNNPMDDQAITLFNNQIVEENHRNGSRNVVGGEHTTTTTKKTVTSTVRKSSQQMNVSNEWSSDDASVGSLPTSGMRPITTPSGDQDLYDLEKQIVTENRNKFGDVGEDRTTTDDEDMTTTSRKSVKSMVRTMTQHNKNTKVDQSPRPTSPSKPHQLPQSPRSPQSPLSPQQNQAPWASQQPRQTQSPRTAPSPQPPRHSPQSPKSSQTSQAPWASQPPRQTQSPRQTPSPQPPRPAQSPKSPQSPQSPQAPWSPSSRPSQSPTPTKPTGTNQTTSTTTTVKTTKFTSNGGPKPDQDSNMPRTGPKPDAIDNKPKQNKNVPTPARINKFPVNGNPDMDRTVPVGNQNQQHIKKTTTTTSSKTTTMVPSMEIASLEDMDLKRDIQLTYEYVTRPDKKMDIQVLVTTRGFNPEELQVKLVDNVLTVTGDHQETDSRKSFARTVTIPSGIKPEDLVCTYDNDGRLVVTAPVPDSDQPRRPSKMVTSTTETTRKEIRNRTTDLSDDNSGYQVTSPMSDVDDTRRREFQSMLTTQTKTKQQHHKTTTSLDDVDNAPKGRHSPITDNRGKPTAPINGRSPTGKDNRHQPTSPFGTQSPTLKDNRSQPITPFSNRRPSIHDAPDTGDWPQENENVSATSKKVTTRTTTVQQQQVHKNTQVNQPPNMLPGNNISPLGSPTSSSAPKILDSWTKPKSPNYGPGQMGNPIGTSPDSDDSSTHQLKSSKLVSKTQQEFQNTTKRNVNQNNTTHNVDSGLTQQQQQQRTTRTSTSKTTSTVNNGGSGPMTGIDLAKDIQLNCDYVKRPDGRMEFQVLVTTRGFTAQDLQVKLIDTTLSVTGDHQEEYCGKSFYRTCTVPSGIRPEDLNCTLDSNGRLLITAIIPEVDSKNNSSNKFNNFTNTTWKERNQTNNWFGDNNTQQGFNGQNNRTDFGRGMDENEQTTSSRKTVTSSSMTKTSSQQHQNNMNSQQFNNGGSIPFGDDMEKTMTMLNNQMVENRNNFENNFGNGGVGNNMNGGEERRSSMKTFSSMSKTSQQQNMSSDWNSNGGNVDTTGWNLPLMSNMDQDMSIFNKQMGNGNTSGFQGTDFESSFDNGGGLKTSKKSVSSSKTMTHTFKIQ